MWIQELYIDAFDGADDLNLNGLSKTLNVIRLPTENEAKQLGRFIPGILYGRTLGNSRPRGGTIGLQVPQDSRHELLLDLSRVGLPDSNSLSDLQILGPALEVEVADLLETVGSDFYLATFTDALPPIERVAVWRKSHFIQQHALPAVAVQPALPVANAARESSAASDVLERWTRIREQIDHAGRATDAEASQTLPSPEQAGVARQDYLSAHARVQTLRQSLPQLRARVAEQESELSVVQRALAIADAWHEQSTLRKKISATPKSSVTPDDIEFLRQLEQELSDRRGKLRRVRESDADSPPVPPRKLHDLQKHLQHWQACEKTLARRMSLQDRLDEATSLEPWGGNANLEQAIAEIRRAGSAGDHCPDKSPQLRQEATPDERIDRLQRQIRQLRDETRRLLARQRLSRKALTGIGTLFAAGVAIIMVSLVFNLDGAELSTGAIGLTCVIAATLLKFSFERTPSERLRQQRMKITQLLEEVAQLREAADSEEQKLPIPPMRSSGTPSVSDDRTWSKLLATYDLPEHCTVSEAVAELRRRSASVPSHDAADRSQLQHDLAACDRKIHRWCQRAADLAPKIAQRPENDVHGAPQWYQLLSEENDRLQEGHAAQQHQLESEREDAIVTLQQQIRELKKERREHLEKFDVSGIADLEKQLERRSDRKHLVQRLKTVQAQIETALESDSDRVKIQEWLDQSTDLVDRLEQHQVELAKSKAAVSTAQNQLQSEQQRIETAAAHRATVTRQRSNQPDVNHFLPGLDLAAAICRRQIDLAKPPTVERQQDTSSRPAAWIKRANAHLHRLTEDQEFEIRWQAYEEPLEVHASSGAEDFAQIDSARQHLVVLALQLALSELVGEQVGRFPVILRDASLRHPVAVCRRISQRILEVSQRDQQILVVTSQEAVTHLFHELSIPTLVVSRHTASDQAPVTTADGSVTAEAPRQASATAVDTSMPVEDVGPAVAEAILREQRKAHRTETHSTDAIFADET